MEEFVSLLINPDLDLVNNGSTPLKNLNSLNNLNPNSPNIVNAIDLTL